MNLINYNIFWKKKCKLRVNYIYIYTLESNTDGGLDAPLINSSILPELTLQGHKPKLYVVDNFLIKVFNTILIVYMTGGNVDFPK